MSIKTDIKLTSVKLVKNLYDQFKHISLDDNINLQQLVNRCVILYLKDEDFREKVKTYVDLKESGSSF